MVLLFFLKRFELSSFSPRLQCPDEVGILIRLPFVHKDATVPQRCLIVLFEVRPQATRDIDKVSYGIHCHSALFSWRTIFLFRFHASTSSTIASSLMFRQAVSNCKLSFHLCCQKSLMLRCDKHPPTDKYYGSLVPPFP